jgi:hypothetical protein
MSSGEADSVRTPLLRRIHEAQATRQRPKPISERIKCAFCHSHPVSLASVWRS